MPRKTHRQLFKYPIATG